MVYWLWRQGITMDRRRYNQCVSRLCHATLRDNVAWVTCTFFLLVSCLVVATACDLWIFVPQLQVSCVFAGFLVKFDFSQFFLVHCQIRIENFKVTCSILNHCVTCAYQKVVSCFCVHVAKLFCIVVVVMPVNYNKNVIGNLAFDLWPHDKAIWLSYAYTMTQGIHWHKYLLLRDEIRILRKRLTFTSDQWCVAFCMNCFEKFAYCFTNVENDSRNAPKWLRKIAKTASVSSHQVKSYRILWHSGWVNFLKLFCSSCITTYIELYFIVAIS